MSGRGGWSGRLDTAGAQEPRTVWPPVVCADLDALLHLEIPYCAQDAEAVSKRDDAEVCEGPSVEEREDVAGDALSCGERVGEAGGGQGGH